MKNMKKLVSLLLAVCLMASLAIGASAAEPTTVDVSGGTGTSSVSLSSTSDGTLDGDPAATKMNVTIPTILPIAVGTDGTVTTATDIRITNNSFGAVKVDNVKVEAGTGWKLTAFGSKDSLAKVKVDSNSTVSKQLVVHLSSARDNLLFRPYQNGSKTPENQGFPGFYYI